MNFASARPMTLVRQLVVVENRLPDASPWVGYPLSDDAVTARMPRSGVFDLIRRSRENDARGLTKIV